MSTQVENAIQQDYQRRKPVAGKRSRPTASRDSISLFTLRAPNVCDVQSLKLDSVDAQKATFRAVLKNTNSQLVKTVKMTVEPIGTQLAGTENVPIFGMTLKVEDSDRLETLAMTTDQALVNALRVLHPDDSSNQMNQRPSCQLGSQKIVRFRAASVRKMEVVCPEWATRRSRTGLALVEWPPDAATLSLLAETDAAPRPTSPSNPSARRRQTKTKEQLSLQLEAQNLHLVEVEDEVARLRRLVCALSRGGPVPADLVDLLSAAPAQSHAEAAKPSIPLVPAAAANETSLPTLSLSEAPTNCLRFDNLHGGRNETAACDLIPPLSALPPLPRTTGPHDFYFPSAFGHVAPLEPALFRTVATSALNPAVSLAASASRGLVLHPPVLPFCSQDDLPFADQARVQTWMPVFVPVQLPTTTRERASS
jgi:hypothetical protein